MKLSNANSIRYGICNSLTGLFLAQDGTWTPCVFDAQLVTSREAAKPIRTATRTQFADEIPAVAIDYVRVRADVRRGALGRPRNVG